MFRAFLVGSFIGCLILAVTLLGVSAQAEPVGGTAAPVVAEVQAIQQAQAAADAQQAAADAEAARLAAEAQAQAQAKAAADAEAARVAAEAEAQRVAAEAQAAAEAAQAEADRAAAEQAQAEAQAAEQAAAEAAAAEAEPEAEDDGPLPGFSDQDADIKRLTDMYGRAPSSGEMQQMYGCEQGYITSGCEGFNVPAPAPVIDQDARMLEICGTDGCQGDELSNVGGRWGE